MSDSYKHINITSGWMVMRPRIFQILNSKKTINSTHPTFWTSASCFCCNLSFSSWYLASISFVFMSNFKENILKVLLIYFSILQKYTIKLNSCMKESIIFHVHLIVTSPAITLHIPIHWVYSVITSKLIKSSEQTSFYSLKNTAPSVILSPLHSPERVTVNWCFAKSTWYCVA